MVQLNAYDCSLNHYPSSYSPGENDVIALRQGTAFFITKSLSPVVTGGDSFTAVQNYVVYHQLVARSNHRLKLEQNIREVSGKFVRIILMFLYYRHKNYVRLVSLFVLLIKFILF